MDNCNDFDAINASYEKSELKAKDITAAIRTDSEQARKDAIEMSESDKRNKGRTKIQSKSFSFLLAQLCSREVLKVVFFVLVVVLFFTALFFSRDLIHTLSMREDIDVAALVSAIVGGLSVLIGLPMVIANYLFNKEESTAIIGLIQQVILSDRTPGKGEEKNSA